MKTKLFSLLCAIAFFSQVVTARTRVKPFIFDDDDDVIDDLRLRQPEVTPIQQLDENVQVIDNNKVISNNTEVQCKPRPIPVPIKVPSHFIITPRYVTLNRCLGPGYTSLQKCAATKKEKVAVKYTLLASGMYDKANYQEASVPMYNDLECGSACIAKPEDCDSKTQAFEDCICKCKLNAAYCQSINRYFDNSACRCFCKNPTECPLYMEWNPETCRCECAGCIKKMCKKHNLGLDSKLCKCTSSVHAI